MRWEKSTFFILLRCFRYRQKIKADFSSGGYWFYKVLVSSWGAESARRKPQMQDWGHWAVPQNAGQGFRWSFGSAGSQSPLGGRGWENPSGSEAAADPRQAQPFHHELFFPSQYGLQRILGDERSLLLLSRAIDPKQPHMMTETVKILSAICIVGEENM